MKDGRSKNSKPNDDVAYCCFYEILAWCCCGSMSLQQRLFIKIHLQLLQQFVLIIQKEQARYNLILDLELILFQPMSFTSYLALTHHFRKCFEDNACLFVLRLNCCYEHSDDDVDYLHSDDSDGEFLFTLFLYLQYSTRQDWTTSNDLNESYFYWYLDLALNYYAAKKISFS